MATGPLFRRGWSGSLEEPGGWRKEGQERKGGRKVGRGGKEGDIWMSVTKESDFWSSCAGVAGAQQMQSGGKAPKRS